MVLMGPVLRSRGGLRWATGVMSATEMAVMATMAKAASTWATGRLDAQFAGRA